MSLEIITGKTGEPHIDSEDIGAYNAYTIGKDSYLLNGLDMSITNVNTLHVGTGEVLFQGRHVRIKGNGEDVAIANGTTGYKRNDILCLKYQKFPQNSDIESISLELIKGTPTTGTPADPAITTGSILNGDTVVYLKLARIVVNGLTPAAPVKLLGTVKTLAETNTSLAATAQTVAQIGASVDPKTSDGWTYFKLDSGIVISFGMFSVTTTGSASWGSVTELTPAFKKALPIQLVSPPLFEMAQAWGAGSGLIGVEVYGDDNDIKTHTRKYQALRPSGADGIPSGRTLYFKVINIGRWK